MNIEIKNIVKRYGTNTVFDCFSMVIPEGDCVTIMGTSGCGKTTLLRMLMGFETPDSGMISGLSAACSVVFQENRLCEELSAVDNVKLVLPRQITRETVLEQLRLVGLDGEALSQPVRDYSGGMKRRVAVVRAMMAESDLILLDEPCNGLDEDTRQMVVQYIKTARAGRTMIVVTHDKKEAEMFGGTIRNMNQ